MVAQWLREHPNLDVSTLALLARLFRVVHLAERELARGTAAHGLQPGWFDVLATLRRAGPAYELNPTDLIDATMLSSGGITKRLDRLAKAGFIERSPDPGDRRGTLVRLTRKGRAIIDRALNTHVASEQRLLEPLSRADRGILDRLLRKLLAELDTTGGAAPYLENTVGTKILRPPRDQGVDSAAEPRRAASP